MMRRYKLFIFDFDGTLVDSRQHISKSVNYALVKNRYEEVDPLLIYPTIGKVPIGEAFSLLKPDLSKQEIEKLTEDFRSYLLESAIKELIFFPGVEETLRKLIGLDRKLAILTTKKASSINRILKSLKVDSLFEVVYGGGMPGGDKPNKGCILYIARKTKIPLDEIVMVGDTSVDSLSASNAGVDSIGVLYGIDGKKIEKAGFTHTIPNFIDLLNFT